MIAEMNVLISQSKFYSYELAVMWVTGLWTSWSCSLTGSPAGEEGGHFIELRLPQLLILYTKRMKLSQMSGNTTLVNRNVGTTEEEINSWSPKNNQKMERNDKTGKTCLLFLANLTGILPAGTLSLGLSLQSAGGSWMSFTLWLIAYILPRVSDRATPFTERLMLPASKWRV